MAWVIALMILAGAAGFIIGALAFGNSKHYDGSMLFYTDNDGKVYTIADYNCPDIGIIRDKEYITLKCVKLPPGFDLDELSHDKLTI